MTKKMAHLAKYLLHIHEDLGLIPRTHVKQTNRLQASSGSCLLTLFDTELCEKENWSQLIGQSGKSADRRHLNLMAMVRSLERVGGQEGKGEFREAVWCYTVAFYSWITPVSCWGQTVPFPVQIFLESVWGDFLRVWSWYLNLVILELGVEFTFDIPVFWHPFPDPNTQYSWNQELIITSRPGHRECVCLA